LHFVFQNTLADKQVYFKPCYCSWDMAGKRFWFVWRILIPIRCCNTAVYNVRNKTSWLQGT